MKGDDGNERDKSIREFAKEIINDEEEKEAKVEKEKELKSKKKTQMKSKIKVVNAFQLIH